MPIPLRAFSSPLTHRIRGPLRALRALFEKSFLKRKQNAEAGAGVSMFYFDLAFALRASCNLAYFKNT
jgi:hypothetical protein